MTIRFTSEEIKADRIGNKGFALYRMSQADLPVPACFYVSVDRMDTIAISDIETVLARLGGERVAVRSSAVGEDTSAASFAGIYVTRLNVRNASGVREALEEVRDSVLKPAATAYRRMRGITTPPQIAAIVQRFINADASGVIFTADPLTGSDNIIVEGCWGLGEASASGAVTPDRWVLSRNGRMLSSTVSDKDVAMVADETEGTKQVEVDVHRRRHPCLTPGLLQRLMELAIDCERLFGSPQDIEWAVESNHVWLLQSRPILTPYSTT